MPGIPKAAPLVAIVGIVVAAAAAFAWTAGWLTPNRLTPSKFVAAFSPPGGPARGYRRNHAKGICFTGEFEANGAGTVLSRALVFATGRYPAIGRFNLSGTDPHMADATGRVRGLGVLITAPDGREWRSAMINAPFFPVSTPQAFYQLLTLSNNEDPKAKIAFATAHPEFGVFGNWAKAASWTASFSQERYNSINSFVLVDANGHRRTVRWAYLPAEPAVPVAVADLGKLGSDFLEMDLEQRVARGALRFPLVVIVAAPGDPSADPSRPWPLDRMTVNVGALVVQHVQAERDGPCRDIVFDPTVLPEGIQISDDPFPAARSAAYARSFDQRTGETAYFPHTPELVQ